MSAVPEPMVSTEGDEMRAALCGAGVLGWGAHRLVFDR